MIETRFYSTIKRRIDHLWPSNTIDPTPYEIFHLKDFELYNNNNKSSSSSSIRHKYLKNIYHQYIKLYHPDISTNLVVLDPSNNYVLTPQEKLRRFKSITVAYKQLLLNIHPTHYNNNNNNNNVSYTTPSSFYHSHSVHGLSYEPEVSEYNPSHILYIILGTFVIWGGSIYLNRWQDSLHLSNQYTVNSQTIQSQDIQRARWQQLYEKHIGFSGSKTDRINRFLWIRLWSVHPPRDEDELESSLRRNHLFVESLLKQSSRKN